MRTAQTLVSQLITQLLFGLAFTFGSIFGFVQPVQAIVAPLERTSADFWDHIKHYDVELVVQPNGTMQVTETIEYYFGNVAPAHGIERYVPTSYSNTWYNDTIQVELQRVTDEQGNPWPVETRKESGYNIWRIGSAATTVSGRQTYVLNYTVSHVFTDYTDYIELYWDAIGTDWTVPIQQAAISVTVPPSSQLGDYQPLCYYGAAGEDTTCQFTQTGNQYVATVQDLGAYQGVSVVFAFAPGSIALPSLSEQLMYWALGNWSLFLIPGWVLLGLMVLGLNRKRRSTKPLIPIYELPVGITRPSEAEYVMSGKVTDRSFTAELVESAIRGEIIFNYNEVKKAVSTLALTNQTPSQDKLAVVLRTLVFGSETTIELKKKVVYRQGFTVEATRLAKATLQNLHWFDSFKKTTQLLVIGYSAVGFVGGGLVASWGSESGYRHFIVTGIVMLITGVLIWFISGRKLPLSVAGADGKQLLEGFKWFLRVTETERLKFSQAPKLTPKLFEQFLPYAIVFGVEQEWVKQFEHILQEPPAWLHGANHLVLYSALTSVGRTTQSFKVPASARSGGSGFSSGGGFSGGGFGGGGGGRW